MAGEGKAQGQTLAGKTQSHRPRPFSLELNDLREKRVEMKKRERKDRNVAREALLRKDRGGGHTGSLSSVHGTRLTL